MTTPQKDFFNMLMKVKTFFANNATVFAGFALILPLIAKVTDYIDEITDAAGDSMWDNTGVTIDKANAQEVLVVNAADVAASARMYFKANGSDSGVKRSDFTESELSKMRDSDLILHVDKMLEIITPVIAAELEGSYNLEAGTILATNTALVNFKHWVHQPSDAYERSSASNKKVDRLIEDSREHLVEKLDPAMLTYRVSNRFIWDYYQGSRLIDNTGSRTELSGFDVRTITINAGATIVADTLPTDASIDDLSIYFKNNGPGILEIGTAAATTGPLQGTQNLAVDAEILSKFSQTGLPALQYLLVHNPSGQQVVFKYGRKG